MPRRLEIINGYILSAHVTSAGIPRRFLAGAVASSELVQVDRGLCALPDVWKDELYVT